MDRNWRVVMMVANTSAPKDLMVKLMNRLPVDRSDATKGWDARGLGVWEGFPKEIGATGLQQGQV
jgi:hypothetical protein